MMKIERSGTESIIKRHGLIRIRIHTKFDVTDPQHCMEPNYTLEI
jgi:hypothetical protein